MAVVVSSELEPVVWDAEKPMEGLCKSANNFLQETLQIILRIDIYGCNTVTRILQFEDKGYAWC